MKNEFKNTPLARRLVRRLKEANVPGLDKPETEYGILSFSPGHHQKSAGAWAWQLVTKAKMTAQDWVPLAIGSADPATCLRKSSKVEWFKSQGGDIEVCITRDYEAGQAKGKDSAL